MNTTNYNKAEMEQLKFDIDGLNARYQSLLEALTSHIAELGQNWVEGDVDAEALLARLQEQFRQFKTNLDAGHEKIRAFAELVDAQIGNYSGAEAAIKAELN